jgi:hypothetical protein
MVRNGKSGAISSNNGLCEVMGTHRTSAAIFRKLFGAPPQHITQLRNNLEVCGVSNTLSGNRDARFAVVWVMNVDLSAPSAR